MVVSSPDLDSLYKILSDYAKKSEFGDYTLKSDRDDIMKRVAKLEKKVEENDNKIEKWEPHWEKLVSESKYLMDTMPTKADRSELEEAIARIKSIIANLNPGNGDAVSAAFDYSELKEAVKKLQGEMIIVQKQSYDTSSTVQKLLGEFQIT